MKNILLLVSSTLLLVNSIKAQNEDADRKFRFGLKVTPTLTWLRSDIPKAIAGGGPKFGFGFGLQTEFRINSTASFVTGIGGDFLGGKQTYKNSQGYVLDANNEFTESSGTTFTDGAIALNSLAVAAGTNKNKYFELKSRSVKTTYVTIPILLKLMTKDISGLKYYGLFGGNIAVQTKFNVTDEISELKFNSTNGKYESGPATKLEAVRPAGDLVPINIGLNVGIGAEYVLSGSTAFFFSVNYLYGFINQYQGTSQIMVDEIKENINNGKKPAGSKQSAFSDGIQLNIGILF